MKAFLCIVGVVILSAGFLFFKYGWHESIDWGGMAAIALNGEIPSIEKVEDPDDAFKEASELPGDKPTDPNAPPIPSIPMERTLVNTEGQPLEATVMAKAGRNLAIRRQTDGKEYVMSLDLLSKADQDFFAAIPDIGAGVIEDIKYEKKMTGRIARWHKDLVNAQREAAKLNLPLYILFTGTYWCPVCQEMDRSVYSQKEFRDFANKNMVLMRVDIEGGSMDAPSEMALVNQFKVTKYPSVVIQNPSGKITYKKSGGVPNLGVFLGLLKDQLAKAK